MVFGKFKGKYERMEIEKKNEKNKKVKENKKIFRKMQTNYIVVEISNFYKKAKQKH